jgi:hypothetical protein
MVQALYLALRLFISGYFAPSLIHAGDSQAETPCTSRDRDRRRTAKNTAGNTAALAVPPKQRTPSTPASGTAFEPRWTQRRWQSRPSGAHRRHPAHVQPKRGNGEQLPPDNAGDDDEREPPMTFTVSQVNAWRAELAAMPAPDPSTRAVDKRAALEMRAKELQALYRRGYTTAELLELLATKGLHTHEETLRAVLRTARPSGPRATTRPRPSQSPTGSSPSAADQIGQEEDRRPDSAGTVTPTAEQPPPGLAPLSDRRWGRWSTTSSAAARTPRRRTAPAWLSFAAPSPTIPPASMPLAAVPSTSDRPRAEACWRS